MRIVFWSLVVSLGVAGAAWSLDPPRPVPGQEQEPAAATAESGSEATAERAAQPDAAPETDQADGEEETLPPLPPELRSTGPTPQRFDPSEEVRADFPVSFPIDI